MDNGVLPNNIKGELRIDPDKDIAFGIIMAELLIELSNWIHDSKVNLT